jgi:hypothetical protein
MILDSGTTLDLGEIMQDDETAGFIRRVLLAEWKRYAGG